MEGWISLSDVEYENVWDRFQSEFAFRPSVHSKDWPSILEPQGSVTYAIGHCFSDAGRYASLLRDLDSKLLQVFRSATPPSDRIYALDWQHECFTYSPHEDPKLKEDGGSIVPFFPDGDYYIHTSQNFSYGIFGHPWEQTMCAFGSKFVAALSTSLPAAFDTVVRRNGRAV
jgi:hypothetical protein